MKIHNLCFTKVNIKLKIFTQKSYSKDVLHAACLDSVKVSMKLKSIFHILAPYRIIGMFVKRCSADQMPMAKFLKICSAYIFKGVSLQNNINWKLFKMINRWSELSDTIKDTVELLNTLFYNIQHNTFLWTSVFTNTRLFMGYMTEPAELQWYFWRYNLFSLRVFYKKNPKMFCMLWISETYCEIA